MGKQTEPQKNESDEEAPMDPLTPQAPPKPSDTVKKKPFTSKDKKESQGQ